MSFIHKFATITATGQISLPKSIRQVLGANVGTKLAFEFQEDAHVPTPSMKIQRPVHSCICSLAIFGMAGMSRRFRTI